MQQPGTLIEGKYEVLAKIREGGMGTIYKVRHRLLDEIRIVKVLRQSVAGDSELKRRFLEEAKTATRLKHPNIGTIYDFALDDNGTAYLVMEFIDGVTLAELMKSQGSPGLQLSLEIASQTLLALGYLHRKNVVHRDIAPDNLMLTSDEEGGSRIKLIDLGVAKVLDRQVEMTSTGVFLGKVRYASPEQYGTLSPGETIDGRSDLYSLGLVIYELLTGVRPFIGETPVELLRAHVFQSPTPFSESDPEGRVPPEVRALVMKALEKNRDNRFSSAEEINREILALKARFAQPDYVDPGKEIISIVRATHITRVAPENVTPSAQDHLDRQFLAQTTPLPSTPKPGVRTDTLMTPTAESVNVFETIREKEKGRDLDGLEALIHSLPSDSRAGRAAADALGRLREKLASEKREQEEKDWARAWTKGSEESWRDYLERHPESPRREEARRLIEEAGNFREVAQVDSQEAWKDFLSSWPQSRYREEVERRIEQAREREAEALDRARGVGSADAYRQFLKRYPKSHLASMAQGFLDEQIAFEAALARDTEPSWQEYLSRWSSSQHSPVAATRLEAIRTRVKDALDQAIQKGTSVALRSFLEQYPQSGQQPLAEQHLREAIEFERAGAEGEPGWVRFLKKHPKGRHADEAREKLRQLEEAALLNQVRQYEEARRQSELEGLAKSHPKDSAVGVAVRQALSRLAKIARREKQEHGRRDWEQALKAGTAEAWNQFLEEHSDSPRAHEARQRLAKVQSPRAQQEPQGEDWEHALKETLPSSDWQDLTKPIPVTGASPIAKQPAHVVQTTAESPVATSAQAVAGVEDRTLQLPVRPEPARPGPDLARALRQEPAPAAGGEIAPPSGRVKRYAVLAGTFLLLLMIGVLWLGHRKARAPEASDQRTRASATDTKPPVTQKAGPPAELGLLVIDALPWGSVDQIADADGKNWLEGSQRYTPLDIRLPPGRYSVLITNPNFPGRRLSLTAEIRSNAKAVCSGRFEPVDAKSYFAAEGWR